VFEPELGPLDAAEPLATAMAACDEVEHGWAVLELGGGQLIKVRCCSAG